MNKGQCPHCQRKIQQTLNDLCLYCGQPLPAAQCFSAHEKERIRQQQQARAAARQKAAEEQQRRAWYEGSCGGDWGFDGDGGDGGD